ncbi:hypothetical protein DFJ73DRAFT_247896 [Zopfochytrium polystomum]|nr:hypothetical protein DFJ73DRAFT_247896 [Zopfochytrium polystomum]
MDGLCAFARQRRRKKMTLGSVRSLDARDLFAAGDAAAVAAASAKALQCNTNGYANGYAVDSADAAVALLLASSASSPSSSPVQTDENLAWRTVSNYFGGDIQSIPPQVIVARMLLLTRKSRFLDARDLFEAWISAVPDAFVLRAAAGHPPESVYYEQLVELYTLHALPGINDFTSAVGFLELNDVLSIDQRQTLLIHLQELRKEEEEARMARAAAEKSEAAAKKASVNSALPIPSQAAPKAVAAVSNALPAASPREQPKDSGKPLNAVRPTPPASSLAATSSRAVPVKPESATVVSSASGIPSPSRPFPILNWLSKLSPPMFLFLALYFLLRQQRSDSFRKTPLGRFMTRLEKSLMSLVRVGASVS